MDPPSSPQPAADAPSPFNNAAADTILRSSDLIDFRVHSVILIEASPFFKRRLSQVGDTVATDGRPVVILSEDSTTLNNLLRFCYPVIDPVLEDLKDVQLVLEASIKYEMDQAKFLAIEALRSFSEREPLRVWAMACHFQLEDEARVAAKHTLNRPILDNMPPEMKMEGVFAGAFFRLLEYRRQDGRVDDTFTFLNRASSPAKNDQTKEPIASTSVSETAMDQFFDHPYADLVCRSSDGTDFRAHRIVLSMASLVIRDMIDKATQAGTEAAVPVGLPVLRLDIPGRILALLLKLCYPLEKPEELIDDMTIVETLLQATVQYGMDRVGESVKAAWRKLASPEPLRAYLLSAQSPIQYLAREAASRTMRYAHLHKEYTKQMEQAAAECYYRLIRYRDEESDAMGRINRELGLGTFWSTYNDEPVEGSIQECSSCSEVLPDRTRRKTCLNCAKKSLNAQVTVRLSASFASRPDALTGIHGEDIVLFSIQNNLWCPSCGQIATFWEEAEDYVQEQYRTALSSTQVFNQSRIFASMVLYWYLSAADAHYCRAQYVNFVSYVRPSNIVEVPVAASYFGRSDRDQLHALPPPFLGANMSSAAAEVLLSHYLKVSDSVPHRAFLSETGSTALLSSVDQPPAQTRRSFPNHLMQSRAASTDASPPFDNVAADIILRSSDGVDFRVHSVILAEASPLFANMFSLPQPPNPENPQEDSADTRDGRPVVAMTEDSTTLDNLLRVCYPIADPLLTDLEAVRGILEAATKYEMEQATAVLCKKLRSFAASEPLRVWAVACRLHLESEALHAAQQAMSHSLLDEFPPEMHEISAGAYFRLLHFQRLNGQVDGSFSFCSPAPSDVEQTAEEEDVPQVDFYAHAYTDVTCRSSDGVDFPAHQIILSLASPVLRDMLNSAAPPKPSVSENSISTLNLPEDSRTLSVLVKLCYPIDQGKLIGENLSLLDSLMQAAAKYQMTRVSNALKNEWEDFAYRKSVRAFLIVARSGPELHPYAQEAAMRSLRFAYAEQVYVDEMERTPADVLRRLLRYRRACREAVTRENEQLNLDALWDLPKPDEGDLQGASVKEEHKEGEATSSSEEKPEISEEKKASLTEDKQTTEEADETKPAEGDGLQPPPPPASGSAPEQESMPKQEDVPKQEDAPPTCSSCGQSGAAMHFRRKMCHKCARDWIYDNVTDAMGKEHKTDEDEREYDQGVFLRSYQEGCYCTECEPIAKFLTGLHEYVSVRVKKVLCEVGIVQLEPASL
ncbi:uncharacterized protein LAESUDRAFT_713772 [Laetiporus sulphureus 93-53]|uniref:BTB domain-containing protein n=1 Tax=Laetiporus sulphureus 93-53 TaxID=1314785 RepID=A0A165ELK5_9APHY|nr:uncharacterized protein LAESUDRAFT_713772 [Laetiporus sulphureus 93-53]KZT07311.1 hypothetical protein LAESUDRAFT_713772 [Laetiporus sulphureus 93-53]